MSWALYLLSTLFRSLRIIFRVDIQDKTKTDGKKNKVSVKEYALKCANILSLSAFYYYLILQTPRSHSLRKAILTRAISLLESQKMMEQYLPMGFQVELN